MGTPSSKLAMFTSFNFVQAMSSTDAMSRAMKGATDAMVRMSKQMNMPQLQNIIRQFQMNSERMEMGQEMMGDAIDDVMEGEGDEEEEEEMIGKVLSELNIGTMNEAPSAPQGIAQSESQAKSEQTRVPMADGHGASTPAASATDGGGTENKSSSTANDATMTDLEKRLQNLRK